MTITLISPPAAGFISIDPIAATEVQITPAGTPGAPGQKGWAPIPAVITDGARRVIQIVDWTGGQGDKPAVGKYVGPSGLVTLIASAVDIRGTQGIQGIQGVGWSPVFTATVDGDRVVLKVTNWTGGTGSKPTINVYVTAAGLTAVLADAIDIRGEVGHVGWSPIFGVATDGDRCVLQIADWINGIGTKPDVGDYLGASGLTSTIGSGVDVRGVIGPDGLNGWSPILGVVNDGARRVFQVVDWAGGTTDMPDVGDYVGAAGLTSVIADAKDIRGPIGVSVPPGGTAGQYLQKQSGTDYDYAWVTLTINNAALDLLQWARFAR